MVEITTVKETRRAIRDCSEVLVQPRFGPSESWVKTRKSDALDLLKGYNGADTARDVGMHCGIFAELMDDGVLYLG